MKCDASQKPVLNAICVVVLFGSPSSFLAASSRMRSAAREGEMPMSALNARSSLRRVTPSFRPFWRLFQAIRYFDAYAIAPFSPAVHGDQICLKARLRVFAGHRLVDDHNAEAFGRSRAPDSFFHHPGGEMGRAVPARARQAITIDDKDLI